MMRLMASVEGDWTRDVTSRSEFCGDRADWRNWLHQLFVDHGAVALADLDRMARSEQRDRANQVSDRAIADVLGTTGRTIHATAFVDEFDSGRYVVRLRVDDTVVNGNGLSS